MEKEEREFVSTAEKSPIFNSSPADSKRQSVKGDSFQKWAEYDHMVRALVMQTEYYNGSPWLQSKADTTLA